MKKFVDLTCDTCGVTGRYEIIDVLTNDLVLIAEGAASRIVRSFGTTYYYECINCKTVHITIIDKEEDHY